MSKPIYQRCDVVIHNNYECVVDWVAEDENGIVAYELRRLSDGKRYSIRQQDISFFHEEQKIGIIPFSDLD